MRALTLALLRGNIAIPHTNGLVPSPELIELAEHELEVLPKEPAV